MLFDYDETDEKSIYAYAKKLEGMTFRDILNEYEAERHQGTEKNNLMLKEDTVSYSSSGLNKRAKGQLGNLLEKYYFGYNPNGNQEADFKKVGIELKQTPIDKKKDGKFRAGERLSITNISYADPVEEDFYKSHVWEKIHKILLIQYLRDKTVDCYDYKIMYVNMFTPPKEDLKIIIDDYNKINEKIKKGKAHELSEGDTMYLGACTKGSTAEKSMRPQYYGDHVLAKKRNFCFKSSYMNYVLNNYVLKNMVPCESILKNQIYDDLQSFVINKIEQYVGKTDEELCSLFDRKYNNNKAQWKDLAFRMLGIKSNHAAEFEKANIVVKTIRIEENGKNKENMSLSTFKFKELVSEEWEDSKLFNYFDATQFLFVIFKRSGKHYVLDKAKMWHMPYEDLNVIVKEEWTNYKKIINQGIKFTIGTQKSGKIIVKNNLPGCADTNIIHIRSHSAKSAYKLKNGYVYGNLEKDGDELPNGEWMTKQSFWLNNDYVLKMIK